MIKSLKVMNGAFAKVGNLQVQLINDVGPSSHRASSTPAHQELIESPALTHEQGELRTSSTSLHSAATSLYTDSNFLLPPYHSVTNKIIPSFAINLEPADIGQRNDDYSTTSKKFEPYEQLTGISQERPEIIMLTNFLPLFTKDVGHSQPSFIQLVENAGIYPFMTDAGKYVDMQIQSRQLRYADMTHIMRQLQANYAHLQQNFRDRRNVFEKTVDELRDIANFLLGLVRSIDKIKAQLDLRHDVHDVDPQQVVRQHSLNFTKISAMASSNILSELAKQHIPASYNVIDTLVGLGYKSDSVRDKFSSSKIWMQLAYELKNILQYHSLELVDADTVSQQRDDNATVINRSNVKYFGIQQKLPSLPNLSDLSNLRQLQISTAINTINQTWNVLYESAHFKNGEANIAALINILSKEFRFSCGLSSPDVQQALAEQFDYPVSSIENTNVLDYVVGKFGNNITDLPAIQAKSLANIASRQPAENVAVLTFESKYVDGDTGSLTPGGTFYVDHVLKTDGNHFDTSRLDELNSVFEKAHKGFSIIINGMNMLAVHASDSYDKTRMQYTSILSSPIDFAHSVIKQLVDERTGTTLPRIANDNMGAVYSYATNNNRVKSALFLLTMARITKMYDPTVPFVHSNAPADSQDNVALIDELINSIVGALESTVPRTSTGNQFTDSGQINANKRLISLSRDAIITSLKSGTVLTNFVESTLQQILLTFKVGDLAMIDRRTRFNGYLDTTIMMIAFDAILQLITRYNNQSIVSADVGHTPRTQGILTFNVSKNNTINFKASINNLRIRLEREVALTQKLIYSMLNTLQKLSVVFKNYSNYLNSPPAIDKLHTVAGLLGNVDLLQMLMSEQQIYLLSSTIQDLIDRASQAGVAPDDGDVDGDGDFDANDEIRVLDDSVISPKLRNALYGLFGVGELASQKGYNKKVLTVGIPLGFTRRLKQRVNISNMKKSTFIDKQNDIIQLVVYKVDLQHSDIVYKPKRFLFEMSRFPVRNDKFFLTLSNRPMIADIINSIPTRDYGEKFGQSHDPLYWPKIDRAGSHLAFDETYSFLSDQEKNEIIFNHIMSYLHEIYVKMLTGINLGDYNFDLHEQPRLVDNEFIKLIIDHHVEGVANASRTRSSSASREQTPSDGVLFSTTSTRKSGSRRNSNSTGTNGSVTYATQFATEQQSGAKTRDAQRGVGSLTTNLSSISHRNIAGAFHGLRTISNFTHMLTSLVDPSNVSRRLVSPKQFDRVFNVMIDPDEFDIDYDKTVISPHGKQALEQMIKKGDIVPATENSAARAGAVRQMATQSINFAKSLPGRSFTQGRASHDNALYKFRDRDKNQGDLAFEKYFVTIETFGEDEV